MIEEPTDSDRAAAAAERALAGNLAKVGDKLAQQGKLFVRDRLDLLLDAGSFVEDALLAAVGKALRPLLKRYGGVGFVSSAEPL